MKWTLSYLLVALLGLLSLAPLGSANAQVIAPPQLVNFLGRLATPNGIPVPDGTYSIRFSLWNAVSAGTEKWNQTLSSVQVKNGTFAVPLSGFPATTFDGNLWLEIKLGTDAPLAPRQQLLSVPYAMKSDLALTVPDAAITGAKISGGTITADKFATGIFNPLAWLLGGNSGTNPASQFLGTTDNQPLVFRTNNTEKMRLNANGNLGIGTNSPGALLHVKGGLNNVAVFAGDLNPFGFAPFETNLSIPSTHAWFAENGNRVFSIQGGGAGYFAGNLGIGVTAPATKLDVAGTVQMTAFKLPTGAGTGKVLASDASGVGTWQTVTSLLGSNSITNSMIQSVDYSKITNAPSGGSGWSLTGNAGNLATDFLGTTDNQPLVIKVNNAERMRIGLIGNISIGTGNTANGQYATVGGGTGNTASGLNTTVAGGSGNTASALNTTVGGGIGNTANTARATVGGGIGNLASHFDSTVGGGNTNTASGQLATVPGGALNTASAYASFAAGYRAKASHQGAFVWADSTDADFASTGVNQFLIRAGGGVKLSSGTTLELGFGVTGKEANAGKIGYESILPGTLEIYGAGNSINNRKIRIWAEGGTTFTGNISVNGTNYTSDARYKTHVQTFPDALDTILNLRGVTFDWDREQWKDRGFAEGKQIGFLAQEVEKVLPELVSTDSNGYKSVAYANVVPVLVEAVKTLKKENDMTKKENAELKARLEALEAAVQRLTVQPK